ncbi:Allatostatins Ast [Lucilia cuprina]|nr:allatostatin-A isoform X2 [Lucilia cuprina]KAI8130307.1 Allatostatin-A [Lucilia cuprina]KNC27956.1 Allatostatins Ast [Lucilia cuprina]
MNKRFVSLLMLACWLSVAYSEPSYEDTASQVNSPNGGHQANSLFNTNADSNMDGDNMDGMIMGAGLGNKDNYDKRVERYAFGLGRRAYTYTNGGNGIKRLPVYNFGLGKRARPYSFGLGKRSDYEDSDAQIAEDLDRAYNAAFMMDEKRNRPYSFGLGKRDPLNEERRANRYGFGLGRR